MPAFDRIVAVIVLGSTLGFLAFRAFRAWAHFRMQQRAVDLLIRSVTELEDRPREPRS